MKSVNQELTYYTLDVFTDTPFGGNPLAVFTDAGQLSDQQMQQIAAELNLSETVFIREQTGAQRWSIRIFMPKREISFAGHPTVGTALLIKALGWLDKADDATSLVLDERAGAVPVVFSEHPKGHMSARFSAPLPPSVSESKLTQADIARMLRLTTEQVKSAPYIAGCGVPFQLVELADVDAVTQASADLSLWPVLLGDDAVQDLCIYSFNNSFNDRLNNNSADIRMRMFAPLAGIPEDPATGSAAAALVGGLAIRNKFSVNQGWMIEQGGEMGRPSLIGTYIRVKGAGTNGVSTNGAGTNGVKTNDVKISSAAAISVEVFGSAVLMSKGTFYLYDA